MAAEHRLGRRAFSEQSAAHQCRHGLRQLATVQRRTNRLGEHCLAAQSADRCAACGRHVAGSWGRLLRYRSGGAGPFTRESARNIEIRTAIIDWGNAQRFQQARKRRLFNKRSSYPEATDRNPSCDNRASSDEQAFSSKLSMIRIETFQTTMVLIF